MTADFDGPGGWNGLTRRQLMRRTAPVVLAAGSLPAFLAACGGSDDDAASTSSKDASATPAPIDGDLRFATYPAWIGEHEYANFAKKYPGTSVKEVATNTTSTNGRAYLIRQNPDDYDMMLLGLAAAPLLEAEPKLIADLNYDNIPNISNVPQKFRDDYPYGIPTDYGKIGFGYRKDLISERPKSWEEVWQIAPKYSGKVVFVNTMEDTFGNTLKMLGFSGNATEESEIQQGKDKLLEIKPHLQSFANNDVSKPMIKGTAVITMDYDYSIALAKAEEPNIEWVVPEEGLMAYLEGWVGISKSKELPTVEAFMNFHLDPVNYADFVNTTGTAYIVPKATEFVKKSIAEDPILAFDEKTVSLLEFEKFKGPEATKMWADAWSEVHAK